MSEVPLYSGLFRERYGSHRGGGCFLRARYPCAADFFASAKTAKSQDRFTHLAVGAARQAVLLS